MTASHSRLELHPNSLVVSYALGTCASSLGGDVIPFYRLHDRISKTHNTPRIELSSTSAPLPKNKTKILNSIRDCCRQVFYLSSGSSVMIVPISALFLEEKRKEHLRIDEQRKIFSRQVTNASSDVLAYHNDSNFHLPERTNQAFQALLQLRKDAKGQLTRSNYSSQNSKRERPPYVASISAGKSSPLSSVSSSPHPTFLKPSPLTRPLQPTQRLSAPTLASHIQLDSEAQEALLLAQKLVQKKKTSLSTRNRITKHHHEHHHPCCVALKSYLQNKNLARKQDTEKCKNLLDMLATVSFEK